MVTNFHTVNVSTARQVRQRGSCGHGTEIEEVDGAAVAQPKMSQQITCLRGLLSICSFGRPDMILYTAVQEFSILRSKVQFEINPRTQII